MSDAANSRDVGVETRHVHVTDLERRLSSIVIAASAFVFIGSLVALPARYPGFDDAKYLGIGLNMLAGRGNLTVFGDFFEPHSPTWSMVIAAPQVWFGAGAYAWAHLLNLLAAGAVLLFAVSLAWRDRPATGALAAAMVTGFTYLFELSRRIGLDMPVAALSIAYLVLGWEAVRRGSVRWAIAAAVVFAIGFLVKESILPFAAAPLLAGVIAGASFRKLVRMAVVMMVIVALLTTWWWLMYAAETGRVYRLGTPAWTLVPIAAALLGAVVVAWRAPPALPASAISGRPPTSWLDAARRHRRAIAWGFALVWAGVFAVFFGRVHELRGVGLFDVGQIAFYDRRWFRELRPVVAVGLVGAVASLVRGAVDRPVPISAADRWPAGRSAEPIWLALLCSLPFVLLVVGVGELPRHFVAHMVLLIVIGSAGIVRLVQWVLVRPTVVRVAVAGVVASLCAALLVPLAGRREVLVVALAVAALVGVAVVALANRVAQRRHVRIPAATILAIIPAILLLSVGAGEAARSLGSPVSALDSAKARAVAWTVDYLRSSVAPGSTLAFGPVLGYETAVEVADSYSLVQIRDVDLVFDATAPLAVGIHGRAPADDWMVLMASDRNPRAFDGYRAAAVVAALKRRSVDIWVQAMITTRDEPLIIESALTPEHGFRSLARFAEPVPNGTLEVVVFGVDRASLGFGRELWASLPAAERLIGQLEEMGAGASRDLARVLGSRLVVVPDGPGATAIRTRLERLTGR